MSHSRWSLFGATRAVQRQIEVFLDKASECALVYEQGAIAFIDRGVDDYCEQKLEQMVELKREATQLRREVDTALYTEMLIPDFRGDVLSLLSDLSHLMGVLKDNYIEMVIEQPTIPESLREDMKALAVAGVRSVEFTVLAARTFFRDFTAVRDHTHKIVFYEAEADTIALRLKRSIFRSSLSLDRQLHLARTVDTIEDLSDAAKDAGDRLSIYAIKRSL